MDWWIGGAVALGLGAVAPLSLGGWRWWLPAAACGVAAVALEPGLLAAALAAPALVAAALAVREAPPLDGPRLLAGLWALVAAGSLVCSCIGWSVLGQQEPFVRLTAVHFLFAGVGALTLATASGSTLAIRCTAAAPPIIALGFVTGWAAPQVGGAFLLCLGVFATAASQLRRAAAPGPAPRRVLLLVSGLAVWAPMVLAVAWAAGQHWDVPALSVPDMARWHGAPNAVLFVLCGLLAQRFAGAVPCDARAGARRTDVVGAVG
jgi:hypothetical protein